MVIAGGIGFAFINLGGDFSHANLTDGPTGAALCGLGFPTDASADDHAIGVALDDYVTGKYPNSPILAEYKSKNLSFGTDVSSSSRAQNINPTLVVAFAMKESSFATVGTKSLPKSQGGQYNPFGRTSTSGGFLTFDSYQAAFEQQPIYLKRYYVVGKGYTTIDQVINTYAPPGSNDTAKYISDVKTWTAEMISAAKSKYNGVLGSGNCSTTNILGDLGLNGDIKLNVPLIKETEGNCNKFADYMAADYYITNSPRRLQAKGNNNLTIPGGKPGSANTCGLLGLEIANAGFSSDQYTIVRACHSVSNPLWDVVVGKLKTGDPVVIETHLYEEPGSQHWVTISGVSADGQTIYFNDGVGPKKRSLPITDKQWADNTLRPDPDHKPCPRGQWQLIYVNWK